MSNTQKNRYITSKGLTKKEVKKKVEEIYQSLPQRDKKILSAEKRAYINNIVNQIMESEEERFKPYKIFKQIAEYQSGRSVNARRIYAMFRNEAPSTYARYNSYLYRQGLSASEYFYQNAEYEGRGSIVNVRVNLPENGKKVIYSTLEIEIDMSRSLIIDINMY